jgi:hypothetical protein
MIIGSLEDKTAQRPDDVGNCLDLGVVLGRNALQLLLRFAILSGDILPMTSPHVI